MTSLSRIILNPGNQNETAIVRHHLDALALDYNETGFIEPDRFYPCYSVFRNASLEPETPRILLRSGIIGCYIYESYYGARRFIRQEYARKILEKPDDYFTKISTFYPSTEYNPHHDMPPLNLVTCFGENKEIIYEGKIDNAPHGLKTPLDHYYYKDWHEVSSRYIGKPEELQSIFGIFLSPHSRDIILKEDLDDLKEGKTIVTADYGDIYEVHYSALYLHEGIIYGLYAYMFD
jgi:hypothetical protein